MESNPAMETIVILLLGFGVAGAGGPPGEHPSSLGVFEGRSDVGTPKLAGAVRYDPAQRRYDVSRGGYNMWFAKDAFHFVWKKMSGDLAIAADIAFAGAEG